MDISYYEYLDSDILDKEQIGSSANAEIESHHLDQDPDHRLNIGAATDAGTGLR